MNGTRRIGGGFALMSGLALMVAACGGGSSSSTPSGTTANAGPQFGVAECDDYFKKYLACIEKMPGGAQSMARQTLDSTRAQWQQAAATEQGKAALAATCKAATDTARTAMSAYGCTW